MRQNTSAADVEEFRRPSLFNSGRGWVSDKQKVLRLASRSAKSSAVRSMLAQDDKCNWTRAVSISRQHQEISRDLVS
jgi:hypothetical protein